MSVAAARFHALIKTHHITSRKKVAKLKHAAATHNVYALLRSGGCPGIMYVEGAKQSVEGWVAVVQRLRYKDFQIVGRIAEISRERSLQESGNEALTGLSETDSVKDFSKQMDDMGVLEWWRKAMGYTGSEDRL